MAGGPLDATKLFVKNQLGQDGKPQFDAAAGATSVQSAASFNQWFNDVPNVNQKTVLSLTLSNGTEPDGRVRCRLIRCVSACSDSFALCLCCVVLCCSCARRSSRS